MLRDDSSHLDPVYQLADLLICAGALFATLAIPGMLDEQLMDGTASFRLIAFGLASVLIWPVVFQILDVYAAQRRCDLMTALLRVARIGLRITIALCALAFLLAPPITVYMPVVCIGAQLVSLCALRAIVYRGARWIRKSDRYNRNIVIVGSGPRAAYVYDVIEQNPTWGHHVLGFVDDDVPEGGASVPSQQVFKLSDMRDLLNDQVVD